MNRRFPIRKPRGIQSLNATDAPPPLPEYVDQQYPIFIYGLNEAGDRPISVRIEDSSLRPTLIAVRHYSKRDYQSKGIGNVYREMEEALGNERVKINIRESNNGTI